MKNLKIEFFRRYALLAVVLVSLLACSATYAGIYVNNVLSGELQNATVAVSLTASVPIPYKGIESVAYACAVTANNVTVPCFTTTTTTGTQRVSPSTTSSTHIGGGGLVVGAAVPSSAVTSAASMVGGVSGWVETVTKTISNWVVALRNGGGKLLLVLLALLGLLLLLASGGKRGRRR